MAATTTAHPGYAKANQADEVLTRLRKVEGQVRGLQKMVEDERYCIDILTQISSTVNALERVGGYLRGTAILSAARAAPYAVFMWALGVPHIVPLVVVVLLGGFIPYIGPFIAMAAIILVALGTVGWQATLVLLVLMLYYLRQTRQAGEEREG